MTSSSLPLDLSSLYLGSIASYRTLLPNPHTDIPRSSVQSILNNPQPISGTRTGRPQIISKRTERLILRTIKKTPKISYAELKKRCDVEASIDTIRRLLRKHYIKKWMAKKRPKLTAEHAKKRLE